MKIISTEDVAKNLKKYIGTSVDYILENGPKLEWSIFNSDGKNIYLISDYYVELKDIPCVTVNGVSTDRKSIVNIPPNKYFDRIATFFYLNIIDYPGKKISEKAVAYMLDKVAWSVFTNDFAEYAVGGPTVEQLIESYNKVFSRGYEVQYSEELGTQFRINRYAEWVDGDFLIDGQSTYCLNDRYGAEGMWLASASIYEGDLMFLEHSNFLGHVHFSIPKCGFRPIVCLKSNVRIEGKKIIL